MNNYRSSFFSNIPPIVKNILAINVVLFVATILLPGILERRGISIDLNDRNNFPFANILFDIVEDFALSSASEKFRT